MLKFLNRFTSESFEISRFVFCPSITWDMVDCISLNPWCFAWNERQPNCTIMKVQSHFFVTNGIVTLFLCRSSPEGLIICLGLWDWVLHTSTAFNSLSLEIMLYTADRLVKWIVSQSDFAAILCPQMSTRQQSSVDNVQGQKPVDYTCSTVEDWLQHFHCWQLSLYKLNTTAGNPDVSGLKLLPSRVGKHLLRSTWYSISDLADL